MERKEKRKRKIVLTVERGKLVASFYDGRKHAGKASYAGHDKLSIELPNGQSFLWLKGELPNPQEACGETR